MQRTETFYGCDLCGKEDTNRETFFGVSWPVLRVDYKDENNVQVIHKNLLLCPSCCKKLMDSLNLVCTGNLNEEKFRFKEPDDVFENVQLGCRLL